MAAPTQIATRAAGGFALVVGIAVATALAASWVVRGSADRRERILLQYADDVTHAWQVQAAADRMVANGRGYLLTNDEAMLRQVKEAEVQLDGALAALERTGASPAERDLVAAVEEAADAYRRQFVELVDTTPATEDRQTLEQALRVRMLPARHTLDSDIQMLMAHERRVQEDTRARAALVAQRATAAMLGLGGGALLLSAILAWLFTRSLAQLEAREHRIARMAEQALRTKEELLRIVAHDLRTPLSATLLRASFIARATTEEQVRATARSIQSTSERMAGLIESLVEAANVESGRLSLSVERVGVADLIFAVIETFGPAAAEKELRLEPAVAPDDLQVTADRQRLLQVLSNLVANALKFTPPGGTIAIRAARLEGQVRFEVRDSGPGIPSEHLGHVFERYWGSEKHAGGGIGLGLYIAKGIVEAHGGRIWVENLPGEGARFFFDIPCEAPPITVAKEAGAPDASIQPMSGPWH
jgi:signal transduction histidine kinase